MSFINPEDYKKMPFDDGYCPIHNVPKEICWDKHNEDDCLIEYAAKNGFDKWFKKRKEDDRYMTIPYHAALSAYNTATLVQMVELKKVQAQLKEANEVIGFYGDENSWGFGGRDMGKHYSHIARRDNEMSKKFSFAVGGKRARAYQKKYKQ